MAKMPTSRSGGASKDTSKSPSRLARLRPRRARILIAGPRRARRRRAARGRRRAGRRRRPAVFARVLAEEDVLGAHVAQARARAHRRPGRVPSPAASSAIRRRRGPLPCAAASTSRRRCGSGRSHRTRTSSRGRVGSSSAPSRAGSARSRASTSASGARRRRARRISSTARRDGHGTDRRRALALEVDEHDLVGVGAFGERQRQRGRRSTAPWRGPRRPGRGGGARARRTRRRRGRRPPAGRAGCRRGCGARRAPTGACPSGTRGPSRRSPGRGSAGRAPRRAPRRRAAARPRRGVEPVALDRGQVRRAQEGHGDAPRRHRAPRVVERDDEAIDVEGAVGAPGEAPDDAHAEPVEQRVRDVET